MNQFEAHRGPGSPVEGAPRRLSSMDDWPGRQSWDLPLGRLALAWRVALCWGINDGGIPPLRWVGGDSWLVISWLVVVGHGG